MNWKCRFHLWAQKRKKDKYCKEVRAKETKIMAKEIISDLAWYNKCHKCFNRIGDPSKYRALTSASKDLGLEDFITFDGNCVELKIELKDE